MTQLINPDLLRDSVAPLYERVDEEVRTEDHEKPRDRRLEHGESRRDGEDTRVENDVVEQDLPVLGLAERHPLALLKPEVSNEMDSEGDQEGEPHAGKLDHENLQLRA